MSDGDGSSFPPPSLPPPDPSGNTFNPSPIVTEVAPAEEFYPAEDYHQGYYRGNPAQSYCAVVVTPKVAKFRKQFAAKLANPSR